MGSHGDPTNANVWAEADVLIGSVNAPIPTGLAPFDIGSGANQWRYVGALDGGQGFSESLEVQSTDHSLWGFGVVMTTYAGQKTTMSFTTAENIEEALSLAYDTSSMTFDSDGHRGYLKVRDLSERLRIAFVTYAAGFEERYISANYATVAPNGAASRTESAMGLRPYIATIAPDASKQLWYHARGLEDES